MEMHRRENTYPRERSSGWIWLVGAAATLVVALVLAYTGIGNHAFWDDEANTALFARNLNDTGTLTGWDGRNLIGYRYGAELNEKLVNVFFPPVQYVVAAIGMTIGGDTTTGGRWLFTLFGVLAIIVTMIWSWLLFKSTKIAVISGLILSVMPTYLLYIRQCRYYSLGVLFSIGIWMLMSLRPVGLPGRLSVYTGPCYLRLPSYLLTI